jgi:hypothetical protein
MKSAIPLAIALLLVAPRVFAQEPLRAWEFNTDGDAEGWVPAHSLAPFAVQGGTLRTEVTAGDPYMNSSEVLAADVEGNDFQYIETRMKLSGQGTSAEFFWSSVVDGKEQGFVAGKERGFRCLPDGQWHTYFVYPLWRGKVAGLRFDPPEGKGATVELDCIRIMQGQRGEHDLKSPVWDFSQGNGAWLAMSGGTHLTSGAAGTSSTLLADGETLVSPALDLKTEDYKFARLEFHTTGKLECGLCWSDTDDGNFPGCNAVQFEAAAGRVVASLRLAEHRMWAGSLKRLGLQFDGQPGTVITLRSLVLADKPPGPGQLQVNSFAAEDAFATLGQAGKIVARVENIGGAPLKGVSLELKNEAVSASNSGDSRSVSDLAPGEAADVTWTVTPTQEGRAAYILESSDGQRRRTELVVSRAFPHPTATEQPAAEIGPAAAWIGNDRVLLTLVKGDRGFTCGRLDAVENGKTRPMAVLPHLASLCLKGSSEFTDLAYQEAASENAGGHVTIKLKGVANLSQARVSTGLCLTLRQGKSYIDATYTLSADKPLSIAAFRGPWMWAGEGSFGAKQDLALFPGSEYMESGERSSSTLDIVAPMNVRFAPHPNTITVPSMAIEKDGATVGLMWDPLQKWDGRHDRPTAVFASPNFIEGHANHLLGLCLPSIPDYMEPNKLLAKDAYELKPGVEVSLIAAFYAEAKSDVLRSMDLYFDRFGLPELPRKPRSYEETVAMSLKSYDSVLWDQAAKGWHGVLQWAAGASPDVALRYYVLSSRLVPDRDFARKLAEKGGTMVDRGDLATVLHLGGAPDPLLSRILMSARAGATQVPADGKFGFTPRETTRSLGAAGTPESGICAQAIRGTLLNAMRSGDAGALDAAMRTLKYMDRFRIPRASQVWECPVHSPDILASGDCCEVYLLAYRITKDPEMLRRAVYWAKTGLPFVYMWQAPDQKPLMKGGSIAIFGATQYVGSWFARPVQWNGLAYARVLLELAKYDQSLPWKHFAEMITISGMNQQSTRENDFGCYTDNWGVVDGVECVGCMLAPTGILENVLEILEAPTSIQTEVLGIGDKRVVINAAPRISGATAKNGAIEFGLKYFAGETAQTTVMPVSEPDRIEVDGLALPRHTSLDGATEGWSYSADIGCLTIKLRFDKVERQVRVVTKAQK